MNSALSDPHNHAPEVNPGDEWGDAEAFVANGTVLPPKRSPNGPAAAARREAIEGLRIESNVQRLDGASDEPRLEVQEIDGSVVRLAPDESDAPARVPRQVTFRERPAESTEERSPVGESRHWGRNRRQSLHWIVGTGLGVASLVVIALLMLPAVNKSNAARPDQITEFVIDPRESEKDFELLNAMVARQPEAETLFRSYVTSTPEALPPLLRPAPGLESVIRERHHHHAVAPDWKPAGGFTWSVGGETGGLYGILEGTMPDFTNFRAYMVEHGGRLVLDWKASTAYGTADFVQLGAGTGDVSEIRALLAPTGFFNAALPESRFRSYQLIAPDGEIAVWVYTERGTTTDAAVANLFAGGEIISGSETPVRVTLRLERGPAGAMPSQWIIGEMLHKEWIKP